MKAYTPATEARPPAHCALCDRHGHDQHIFRGSPRRHSGIWSALRILREVLVGYRALDGIGAAATVFGSARVREADTDYALARTTGSALAERGFTVITGGGPGIMEAANRGAREAGGHSIGCNIRLPREQAPNAYLDRMLEFDYFFVRKLMLVRFSCGFVIFPGGFGTMDELFETLTLVQNGKLRDFPIVLMGSSYWTPFLADLRQRMLGRGLADAHDLELAIVTDDPDEAVTCIANCAARRFGIELQR